MIRSCDFDVNAFLTEIDTSLEQSRNVFRQFDNVHRCISDEEWEMIQLKVKISFSSPYLSSFIQSCPFSEVSLSLCFSYNLSLSFTCLCANAVHFNLSVSIFFQPSCNFSLFLSLYLCIFHCLFLEISTLHGLGVLGLNHMPGIRNIWDFMC